MAFLYFLASIRNPLLDYLMLGITYIGTPFVIVGVIFWFYLNEDKEEAFGMLFAFCYSCLLCQGIKILVRIPRPWNLDTSFSCVQAALSGATGYSFPSIHTQAVTSFFVSLSTQRKSKTVRIISVIGIALVAFSRMYLGCHTPLDVGTGFAASFGVTLIVWFIWNRHHRSFEEDNLLPLYLVVFAIFLTVLASAFLWNGTIDFDKAKDSFETAGLSVGFAAACLVEHRRIRFSVSGSLWKKILRFVIGIAGALALSAVLKKISATSAAVVFIRYALMGLWVTVCTPLIAIRTGLMTTARKQQRLPKI